MSSICETPIGFSPWPPRSDLDGRSIGAYCVSNLQINSYSEMDADFLTKVAGQLALAVENLRSYHHINVLGAQIRQSAERSRSLLDINNAIILKLNQDELFRTICQAPLRVGIPEVWG